MTPTISRVIAAIPKIVVALLLVAAIVNLLIGVVLRYVVVDITDYLDLDPVPFTWVEEVGEMLLAWLTLLGAAIGVRERSHFTLHVLRLTPSGQKLVDRIHHVLIAILGTIAAWYGGRLCMLNHTLVTPGLSINLAMLYASVVAGGVLLVVYAISMIVAPPPGRDAGPLEVRAE
jgi:TRAP-type C4-dicarboxylate transport system permease small subunit